MSIFIKLIYHTIYLRIHSMDDFCRRIHGSLFNLITTQACAWGYILSSHTRLIKTAKFKSPQSRLFRLLMLFLISFCFVGAEEQITFSPPAGWSMANREGVSDKIKIMVVGITKSHFPPSISLGYEPYTGTMEEYVAEAKKVNTALKSDFRDLGAFDTTAGKGRLVQIDSPSEWGDIRILHLFLIRDKTLIVVTAASLKSEFKIFYQDFFTSLKSLQISRFIQTPGLG